MKKKDLFDPKANEKKGWTNFLKLCTHINSAKELDEFFHCILTIEERETISSRYLIIKALLEGKLTQREIAEQHKVSISQITRGSNALKIISPKLRDILTKSML